MVGGEDGVALVEVSWLKAHEEIKPKNRDKLLEMTKRWGGYTRPLLVDSKTGAILDGHHRYSVAIELGLTNRSIHKINESVKEDDLVVLKNIYNFIATDNTAVKNIYLKSTAYGDTIVYFKIFYFKRSIFVIHSYDY